MQKVVAEIEPKVLRVESKNGWVLVFIEKKVIEAVMVRDLKELKDFLSEPC